MSNTYVPQIIRLSLTLNELNLQDSLIIAHIQKYRAGRGSQEKTFELKRLLLLGMQSQSNSNNAIVGIRQSSDDYIIQNRTTADVINLAKNSELTIAKLTTTEPTSTAELLVGSVEKVLRQALPDPLITNEIDKMNKTILASDIGYGNTKSVFDLDASGSWNELCFKSNVPKETYPQAGANQALLAGLERISIQINGRSYLVGPEAYVSGGSAILGTDYIDREEHLALLRGSIYYMMKKTGTVKKHIDILVLGLPVSNWKHKSVQLTTIGKGPHLIPVPAALKASFGEAVEVTVGRVVVLPQPMGALHNSFHGRSFAELNADKSIHMIIDPGYNTFDWFVSVGIRPDLQRSGSLLGGVSQLLKLVSNAAGAKLGVGSLNLVEVERGLETGTLNVHGRRLPMGEFRPLMQAAAAEVVDKFLNSIDMNLGIDTIHLVGGGAKFYVEALRSAFSDYNIEFDNASVMSNVRGFYLVGKTIIDSA